MSNVRELLHKQEMLKIRIDKMIYGAIEIREKMKINIFMCIFANHVYLYQNM